jgi:hypothetical protein
MLHVYINACIKRVADCGSGGFLALNYIWRIELSANTNMSVDYETLPFG